MKDFLTLVFLAFVAGFLFTGYATLKQWTYDWAESRGTEVEPTGTGGRTVELEPTAIYDKAGISFLYPRSWRPFPSGTVSTRRTQLTSELRKFNRILLSLDMYVSSDEEAAFFISKVQADSALSADRILSERRKFYADATRAGDVTRINELEIATVNGLPALVEDIERSNGGRGHTIKLLKGRLIVELSLVVNDKSKYNKHACEYEQILVTLNIQD